MGSTQAVCRMIEVDEQPNEKVRDDLRALPWVRWTHRIDKVGG